MSFDKLPIVDRFSKNEDESNSYFRLHFCQRNGFMVSRPEADKGCDFLVELIRDDTATNWRFPVQLKSVEVLNFIENDTLITYSFEVSRLRYMLESIPPVGLIVLYCPGNQTLYYDYAEAIFNRLMEKREGNSSWKSQQVINIHIPASQVVGSESLSGIHRTRHQNSKDRSPALYPLAASVATDPVSVRQTAPGQRTADVLKEKGMEMFYNHEIPALTRLVEQTSLQALKEDAHLSLLAGLSNWSMGYGAEASFWLDKALRNPLIKREDQQYAAWLMLYLDMLLGKISFVSYNEELKARLRLVPLHEEELRLKYELTIARNEVDLLGPGNLGELLERPNQWLYYSHRIASTRLTAATAVGFYLENVTTLGIILIKSNIFIRRSFADQRKQGIVIDAGLIAEVELMTAGLKKEIEFTLTCIKSMAGKHLDKIALARCYECEVSFWLEVNLTALVHPISKFDYKAVQHKNTILQQVSYASEAVRVFMGHQYYNNALSMTRMLLELCAFADQAGVSLDIDRAALSHQVDALQKKLDVPGKELHAPKLIDAYEKD